METKIADLAIVFDHTESIEVLGCAPRSYSVSIGRPHNVMAASSDKIGSLQGTGAKIACLDIRSHA